MYPQAIVLASALVAGTAAQSTSVASLYLYDYEGQNLVASVISAAPEATSYFVNCAPGTDGSDCGFGPGVTFVNGPSTFALHVTESGAFSMDVDCKISSKVADCAQTNAGPEANDPGIMTGVVSDFTSSLVPVTITAGLEKLSAGDSATATATGSSASGTAEPTGSAASGPSETGSSATGTSTSASSTSSSSSTATNGAVAGAGQNLVLAGLSGVLGLMMAL